MSSREPGEAPEVYTMPPGAYRVGDAPRPAPAEPEPPRAAAGPRPQRATREPRTPRPDAEPERAASERPARRRRGWDLALTPILLVLAAVAAAVASTFGAFLAFAADGCGPANCDSDLLTAGVWVALTVPWLIWVLAVVAAVWLLVVRRRGFWIPLVGIVLMAAGWLVGAWLVGSAIT